MPGIKKTDSDMTVGVDVTAVGTTIPKVETGVNYDTDPSHCPEDMIINAGSKPQLLPSGENNNSTIRLEQGSRIRGPYFASLVTKHKIPSLQLCCRCKTSQLVSLEEIRQRRIGTKPEDWIAEAWALKKDGDDPDNKKRSKARPNND